MATEFVYLSGKTKWFRPQVPDMRFAPGKWNHVLYPDTKSLEIIRELQADGVKNQLKKDDDGYYINLSRKVSIISAGKVVGMQPPSVVDGNGMPLHEIAVGNGSDITSKCEVYSHKVPGTDKKAKAMRWLSTRIDNLVPFKTEKDFTDVEERAVKELDKQPQPVW